MKFDFTDTRVAAIGTGASAIRFVPQIPPESKQLDEAVRSSGGCQS
ncbi:MAG: hypothetical protein ACT4PZ_21750 [Panacagrimonas sp.]